MLTVLAVCPGLSWHLGNFGESYGECEDEGAEKDLYLQDSSGHPGYVYHESHEIDEYFYGEAHWLCMKRGLRQSGNVCSSEDGSCWSAKFEMGLSRSIHDS